MRLLQGFPVEWLSIVELQPPDRELSTLPAGSFDFGNDLFQRQSIGAGTHRSLLHGFSSHLGAGPAQGAQRFVQGMSDVAEGGAIGLPLGVTMKSSYFASVFHTAANWPRNSLKLTNLIRSPLFYVNRVRKARYCRTVTVVRAPTDWPLAPGARVISVSLYRPGSTFLKDRLKATFTAPSSKGST